MKVAQFVTFTMIYFVINTSLQDNCESTSTPSTTSCTQNSAENSLTKCCLVSFKLNGIEHQHCYLLGNTTDNINHYKKYQLKDMDDIQIDCSSSYLIFSFSIIILISLINLIF